MPVMNVMIASGHAMRQTSAIDKPWVLDIEMEADAKTFSDAGSDIGENPRNIGARFAA